MNKNRIRVLVVDDSALMRKVIPQMLAADDSIEVVGTAVDGSFCLKKIEELRPHVVTLDLEMPGMNGIDTLKEIMRSRPVPVIVFSSHSVEGASVTFKALGLGAFDFVTKPKDATTHMAETARELISKVKAAAESKLKPRILPSTRAKIEKSGCGYRPDQDRGHRNFDGRAAGARIPAGTATRRFSRVNSGRAAHAGGLH